MPRGNFSLSTCVPALRAPDLQFGVHLGSQEAILPIVHFAKQWKRWDGEHLPTRHHCCCVSLDIALSLIGTASPSCCPMLAMGHMSFQSSATLTLWKAKRDSVRQHTHG